MSSSKHSVPCHSAAPCPALPMVVAGTGESAGEIRGALTSWFGLSNSSEGYACYANISSVFTFNPLCYSWPPLVKT